MGNDGENFSLRSAAFVDWFKHSTGARLTNKIELADLRVEGAGRVALQDLHTDEELFAIPRSLVLAAPTSSIPLTVLDGLEEAGSWPPLIVTIIYEYLRGNDSPWHPYFEVLPSSFDTLMFWTDAELQELQASAVVRKIGKAGAEASWKETIIPAMLKYPDLFPVGGPDDASKTAQLIQLAHMAGSLIMAYAFDIDRDDDESRASDDDGDGFQEDDEDEPLKGMVPFADMLNADADRNNARLFQEGDYLIMKATKAIQAGQEIFNDYGPLPRSDLLRMYGYVTDHYAQYDVVEFEHTLLVEVAGMRDPEINTEWLKREEQLDEIGIIDDGYALSRLPPEENLEHAIPGNIHMLLRALTADPKISKMPKMKDESVSIQEAALLSAVATKKLAEYPTSLDQDRAIVSTMRDAPERQDPTGSSAKRYFSAVSVRAGEKEILRDLIGLCQSHIATKTTEISGNDRKRKNDDTGPTSKKTAKTNGGR